MRNAMDSQEIAVGWWPGDTRYQHAAFYAYAHPAPQGFADFDVAPGRWGSYFLGQPVPDGGDT